MGFIDVLFEFCKDLRMFRSHVGLLSHIGCQVVQLRLAVDDHQLPVSGADRLLVSLLIEFPIQVFVLLLLVFLSKQRRCEAEAVDDDDEGSNKEKPTKKTPRKALRNIIDDDDEEGEPAGDEESRNSTKVLTNHVNLLTDSKLIKYNRKTQSPHPTPLR